MIAAVELTINGIARRFDPPPGDLARLVAALGLEGKRIAVEHNGAVVARSRYQETPLADGDRIEIVGAVGGG